MASIRGLLKRLDAFKVEFVIVGGVAGVLHSSNLATRDLDICGPLTLENLTRILNALSGLAPRSRMILDERADGNLELTGRTSACEDSSKALTLESHARETAYERG